MKYQLKQTTVDAFQWTGGPDQTEDPEWICEALKDGTASIRKRRDGIMCMTLDTPDFTVVIAKPGDYIMRYANGELSAVSPEVFLAEFRPCGKPGKMDKEYLKEAAVVAIDAKLPDNHGFILLTAPYGEGENRRLTYISSMERATAISTVKEWLIKAGGEEEWMKHIK